MTKQLIQKKYFVLTAVAALIVTMCVLSPTGSTRSRKGASGSAVKSAKPDRRELAQLAGLRPVLTSPTVAKTTSGKIFFDDFNRTSIGSAYTAQGLGTSGWTMNGDRLRYTSSNVGGQALMQANSLSTSGDMIYEFLFNSSTFDAVTPRLQVQKSDDSNYYWFNTEFGSGASLFRDASSVNTELINSANGLSPATDYRIKMRVGSANNGETKLWINENLVGSGDDAAPLTSPGTAALWAADFNGGTTIDFDNLAVYTSTNLTVNGTLGSWALYKNDGTTRIGPCNTGATADYSAITSFPPDYDNGPGAQVQVFASGVTDCSGFASATLVGSAGDEVFGGDTYTYDESGADITSPVRSNGQPTGVLPAGTTQTNISLTTNENATCRYSTTANTPYASMANTFSTTGATSHSTQVTGLANGNTYNYYVRCIDGAGNANPTDFLIAVTVSAPDFQSQKLITGLDEPTGMAFLPDGRMLIAEKKGRIWIVQNGANSVDPTPFLDITNLNFTDECGLDGITVDPNFPTNGYIYIFYTAASPLLDRVSRFTASFNQADLSSEVVLWQDDNTSTGTNWHRGGGMMFGGDGKLYFSVGDHLTAGLVQDLTSYYGKILRINADGTIPSDNPFFDGSGPNKDEIWMLGFRNPFRFYVDPITSEILVGDVGEDTTEEVDRGVKGGDYGWPQCEGSCAVAGMINPIYEYLHNGNNASVIGGFTYTANQFPAGYQGSFFIADYAQGWIKRLTFDGSGNVNGVFDFGPFGGVPTGNPVELVQGPDGSLYYVDIAFTPGQGSVRKVTYFSGNQPPTAIASASPTSGLAPLTVNFSSSGSADPEGGLLSYNWDFGDGTFSTDANPSHIYPAKGPYTAKLKVSDGTNQTISEPIQITVGTPPVATITAPTDGSTFIAGDVINFSGTATDADGSLSGSSFSWRVRFLHDDHFHPFLDRVPGTSGSFTVPTTGHDFRGNARYEITLTVTDSDGLQDSKTVYIFPRKVNVTFRTSPANLNLSIDGITKSTSVVYDDVIGFQHNLDAMDQTASGTNYVFASWSDGGAKSHDITTPNADQTYTATFKDRFTRQDISSPAEPYAVAVADFNGDGKADIAVTNFPTETTSAKVAVYLGNGDGTFGSPSLNRVSGEPSSIAVGDLNGDGKMDIVSSGDSSNDVSVLLGNGDGTFQNQQPYDTGAQTHYVWLVDLNNDNKLDIVVAADDDDLVSILLNNGDGTFAAATNTSVETGGRPHSVTSGDFNGDGKQDLAVSLLGTDHIAILLGNGDGTFNDGGTLSVGAAPHHVIATDLNNDGKVDLVDADSTNLSATVMRGDGAGGFTQSSQPSVGEGPLQVRAWLFDADVKTDLVTVNNSSNDVAILQGNGNGTFAPATRVGVGLGPTSVAVGDFNGDNKQDLVVVNRGDSTLSIILNSASFPTPTASISGQLIYSDGATPVPNATMTLTGPNGFTPVITSTDSNGNYSFTNVPQGSDYTVTPTKNALPPGAAGIDTVDVLRTQFHFLGRITLTGLQLMAADANGDSNVNTIDVIAIQHFFLGMNTGTANAGQWRFSPATRSYPNLVTNQSSQNYDGLVIGDTDNNLTPTAAVQTTPSAQIQAKSVSTPAAVATVSLPNASVSTSITNFTLPVTTTNIDPADNLVGFQGTFTFDSSVVSFQNPAASGAGLTANNWNVSANINGSGTIKTLVISAFSNNATPLSGSGTLFNLNFTRVSSTSGASTALTWAAPPNNFEFIDSNLATQTPGSTPAGSITIAGPTATSGSINGTITDANGVPVSGATINLSGGQSREAITDRSGQYRFDGVETNGFYTVTPSRANYTFSPTSRSFSLLGVQTEASFTANPNGDRANAIDTTEFFVRQHYLDFLGREPDPPGFIGWVNTLRNCAAGDASCDRVHVSESFYRSQEFQERGYFAYRFYATAFGRKPDYAEFKPDLQQVSGFLTNDQLEAAKTAFVDDFMTRPGFALQYNRLSNSAYVDALLNTAGVNLSTRQAMIDSLNRGTSTRAQVLRQIVESGEVYQRYYNQAFVVMEYFGYLRRDPDALYTDWIGVLDANPTDSRRMVEGFVNSIEYRNRFAQ